MVCVGVCPRSHRSLERKEEARPLSSNTTQQTNCMSLHALMTKFGNNYLLLLSIYGT